MLRNGLDFALRARAGSAAVPLVVLTGYIVEDPAVMPVDVAQGPGSVLHVRSRTGRPEILAVAGAPLETWAAVSLHGAAGSFGRHSDATLTLRRPGLVLVARPDGVERLGEVRLGPEGR